MLSPALLAERIKKLAATRGLSVTALLKSCGINKNGVFTMENSGYYPRLEKIQAIAERLGVSVSDLLAEEAFIMTERGVSRTVTDPNDEDIRILAALFKVPPEFLLTEINEGMLKGFEVSAMAEIARDYAKIIQFSDEALELGRTYDGLDKMGKRAVWGRVVDEQQRIKAEESEKTGVGGPALQNQKTGKKRAFA